MKGLTKCITLSLLCILFGIGCSRSQNSVPGYIEGEYTYISSGVSGTLLNLYVERGDTVNKGVLLYQLDPQPQLAGVEISKSNIKDLRSQVEFAKIELDRQLSLFYKKHSSGETVDRARTDYNSKIQQLTSAQSQLIQSQWSLSQKKVYSPVSGKVFDVFYRIGEKVQENHPVLAILAPQNIKALFYIAETKLNKVKLGQIVEISCDGCEKIAKAKIIYISPEAEYTPPIIYSKDTRYKLVYLIRAQLLDNTAMYYHPGQPIDVFMQP